MEAALNLLRNRLPVFVLFSNYFRVRPLIHLDHAGNSCRKEAVGRCAVRLREISVSSSFLLFYRRAELSNLGKAAEPAATDVEAQKKGTGDQLDNRSYQLNAASVRLTDQIVKV